MPQCVKTEMMDVIQHKRFGLLIFNYNFMLDLGFVFGVVAKLWSPTDSLCDKPLYLPIASRLAGRPLEPAVQLVTSLPI
jgi:hypothetical protein